jgi:hypothetical protein
MLIREASDALGTGPRAAHALTVGGKNRREPMKLTDTALKLGLLLAFILPAACGTKPDSTSQPDALQGMKKWVDSFQGMSAAQVRARLAPASPKEQLVPHDGRRLLKLEFEFADYAGEFYFSEDVLVMVSLDVFPGRPLKD